MYRESLGRSLYVDPATRIQQIARKSHTAAELRISPFAVRRPPLPCLFSLSLTRSPSSSSSSCFSSQSTSYPPRCFFSPLLLHTVRHTHRLSPSPSTSHSLLPPPPPPQIPLIAKRGRKKTAPPPRIFAITLLHRSHPFTTAAISTSPVSPTPLPLPT